MAIKDPKNSSLGTPDIHAFPKVQYAKIKEIIDAVNNLTDGSITTTDLTLTGTLSVAGAITNALVTDSTSKDTGAVILEGGLGVEKAIFAGTTINAGTALSIGTNVTLAKEVNHTVTVTTTTTAATAGGNLTLTSGQGATSGAGGTNNLISGAGGVTGDGGVINITSGAGGSTSGASGAINVSSGTATVGSSGTLTITSGNTGSGVAGDVILTTGTHTSTTVVPVISLNKAVIRKPASATVASGGTITGPELVSGLITATGATGSWNLPTAAQITTAIGSTPAGTNFEFIFNASGMTATNTATLVVGTDMTVMSAPAITGGGTLTVTQDTQVIGLFRVFYDTATTCKISRIA